jgi:hypothetical protein
VFLSFFLSVFLSHRDLLSFFFSSKLACARRPRRRALMSLPNLWQMSSVLYSQARAMRER